MLKVRVRIEKMDQKDRVLKLEGFSEDYPEIGQEFSMYVLKRKDRVYIDLGKVFNIKTYGDMMLIQTDLTVAEVWILGGEREREAEILPFIKDRNTLFLRGGKITSLNKSTKSEASSRIKSLIKELKVLREQTVGINKGQMKPALTLLEGGRNEKVNPSPSVVANL